MITLNANIKAIFVALKGCPLLINLEVETYATMYQGNASVVIKGIAKKYKTTLIFLAMD